MSHVVVYNASAKSVRIPTTPMKYLTEVRDEACQKLSMNKNLFTLKYNSKPVELSQQIRLANLVQGARLELVQASRSPTVIMVALQLPEKRLTKKLPNNYSLWEVLRQFESDPSANYNFTQRGVPEMSGKSGAGRLHYEQPVITVLPEHKKFSTLVDLQKTLSQLGFDKGSALLKLGFENSGQPLEAAMAQITLYFNSSASSATTAPTQEHSQTSPAPVTEPAAPEAATSVPDETIPPTDPDPTPMDIDEEAPAEKTSEPPVSSLDGTATENNKPSAPITAPAETSSPAPFSRSIRIFAPSSSPTPQAARYVYNEADFIPTVEHAKSHQASLNDRSRNTRLLSDKELEEQERARQEKLQQAADKGGRIRLKLPDSTLVEANISKEDTATDLYDIITDLLEKKSEPFCLLVRDGARMTPLQRDTKRLFQDVGFQKSELLVFQWAESASNEARSTRSVLSEAWKAKAEGLKIEDPVFATPPEPEQSSSGSSDLKKKGGTLSAEEKENKLKHMLKGGLFKKTKK
ncbi:hypothetical protein P280DRAFT_467023 [Massarina eburnea CBS 473.64]|uniref:UBX domain-containing protein n=1 Tax=Massarina eburnea CBS 473.64 TaxID=1395130 RepID=A0A6A6S9F3_9PLEO|nr:hypothetical protein P280DRAFT_467023 [Massarina eburnea CBS 473.64]